MHHLLEKRVAAWAALMVFTMASWALGVTHGFGHSNRSGNVIIVCVAVVKVGLVGLYFMEIRYAPALLRLLFAGYCAVAAVLLTGLLITT